jgi:hydroxyacylglutathione hydrolase
MYFEKIISEGLEHNSYFVEDGGYAFVIDPRIDIDIYLDIADKLCAKMLYVFETHRNEDYLAGSKELQKITGCQIIHGNLDFNYGEIAPAGSIFDIGNIWIKVIETPGHSPESLSYVMYMKGIPWAIFTGDSLFYGSTGRVDLFGHQNINEFALALYNSVNKILTLGNDVLVYPAHGAGTACGGDIADIPLSTIGYELKTNPILNLKMDEFIEMKKEENIPLPPYFERMARENLKGYVLYKNRIRCMDAKNFKEEYMSEDQEYIILDTRSPLSFASGHIPNSYNIWLKGLPKFAGWILDYDKNILIVSERMEDINKIEIYLARIGFNKIEGYLCGGIEEWKNLGFPLEQSGVITVDDLDQKIKEGKDLFLLDVRGKDEFDSGHIHDAKNIYIGELEKRLPKPKDSGEIGEGEKSIISMCEAGNRASLGVSILKRHGYKNVFNLMGGMGAWRERGYKTEK